MKPITIALEAAARLMSFSVIPPTPVWMTLTRTSGWSIFWSSQTIASTEPWTSPLRTMFRSCDAARLHLLEQRLERDAAARLLRERLAAQALAALVRELARLALVLDHAASSPAGGGLSKPRISTGSPGPAASIFSPR